MPSRIAIWAQSPGMNMTHQVNRRQKPVWKQVRRPLPPPGKPHSTKKGGKGYDRKEQGWKKEVPSQ